MQANFAEEDKECRVCRGEAVRVRLPALASCSVSYMRLTPACLAPLLCTLLNATSLCVNTQEPSNPLFAPCNCNGSIK